MQRVLISNLKGLIKVGDYVGDSMKLKEVQTVDDEGFSCYNDYGVSKFNNDNNSTVVWVSQYAMLNAVGISLQQYTKHCIKKEEKE